METERPKLQPIGPTARYLRVPVKWLRAEAEAGRVPCLRADSRFLFDPQFVERALLKRVRQTSSSGTEGGTR